jgi:glucan phosphoethanolaminetransferase (alkaline phosphatase superfamily)
MIDEKNWKNKNCDRDQMSVDEKKRFENLERKRFENLDENLDDDFENNLENANSMNTKFVNLHVIFFFSI